MNTKIMLCPECSNGFLAIANSRTMIHRWLRITRTNGAVRCPKCNYIGLYKEFKPVDKVSV